MSKTLGQLDPRFLGFANLSFLPCHAVLQSIQWWISLLAKLSMIIFSFWYVIPDLLIQWLDFSCFTPSFLLFFLLRPSNSHCVSHEVHILPILPWSSLYSIPKGQQTQTHCYCRNRRNSTRRINRSWRGGAPFLFTDVGEGDPAAFFFDSGSQKNLIWVEVIK